MTDTTQAIKSIREALASGRDSDFENACSPDNIAAVLAHVELLEARYQYIKSMRVEEFAIWRGAFGLEDKALDDAIAQGEKP